MTEEARKAADLASTTGAAAVKLGATAIGKIVVSILAIVVLWMAVMVALKSSEITAEAVKPIAEFGGSMGKLALDMPKYMPIPLGGGHKTSMAGLQSMGSNISTAISQKAVGDSSQIGQSIGNKIAGAMGYQDTAISKALNKMDQTLARINSSHLSASDIEPKAKLARELMQSAVNETGMTPEQALNSPDVRAKITAGLQKLYSLTDKDVETLKKAPSGSHFDTEFKNLVHHNVSK